MKEAKNYIVTFHSHFDALIFSNYLEEKNIASKLMPVPRNVSASCGTCVAYESNLDLDYTVSDVEAVYLETSNGFSIVHS